MRAMVKNLLDWIKTVTNSNDSGMEYMEWWDLETHDVTGFPWFPVMR